MRTSEEPIVETITVQPGSLRGFGPADGATFCLVTNASLTDRFRIASDHGYARTLTLAYDAGTAFDDLLGQVPEPAHVLVVSPRCLVESPRPDRMGQRKLIAMACNSTETSPEAIEHFLRVMERADPARQGAFAEGFFDRAAAAERLRIVDEEAGTEAVFEHQDESYEWNQQAGPIDWGEQQLGPPGELSVLPANIMEYRPELRMAISGELAMKGRPIVHAGSASYLRSDQERIFARLATMKDAAVIASVDAGVITGLRASHEGARAAANMLESLFENDSRYRVVWEIGFGINTDLTLFPGNVAMNEVYGGASGVFHFGVGLTPYTQYAPIFICPESKVLTPEGEVLVGPRRKKLIRKTSGSCPCVE